MLYKIHCPPLKKNTYCKINKKAILTPFNYQKFIILGHLRSGANHLLRLLANHPHIACHITLKKPLFKKNPDPTFFLENILLEENTTLLCDFIESNIFLNYPSRIKAVGFKLLYQHFPLPVQKENNPLKNMLPKLDMLLSRENRMRAIWLTRKNSLRTLVSRELSLKTKLYFVRFPHQRIKTSILLNQNCCSEFFKAKDKLENFLDIFLEKFTILKVYYEELVTAREGTLVRILDFLKLQKMRLRSDLIKQNTRPLPELIENYSELKKNFKGTRWEIYFED